MARETIEQRLVSLGYTDGRAEFDTILADVFHAFCPDWTDEELTYHPKDASRFCTTVRTRCGCKLPDELILRTLVINRKRGESECAA
jgi:hypothetical protein